MMDNRSRQNDYMVDFKERSAYEHEQSYEQAEYVSEQAVSQVEDFSSFLYYNQEPQQNQTIPAPKTQTFDEVDVTPSVTTMGVREEAEKNGELPINRNVFLYESDRATEQDRQYRVNAKGKVLIAVYAIVVMTIFALIVLNTSMLSNMNKDVAMMQTKIQALQTEQTQLTERLSFVSSDAEIERKAVELGMSK